MAATDLTPEALAAMHPELFRTVRPPLATFAEQYVAALAVVNRSMPPAACQLAAELQAAAQAIAQARRVG